MEYRLVFEVADRLPAVPLAGAALVSLLFGGVVAVLRLEALLRAWPLLVALAGVLATLAFVLDHFVLVALAVPVLAIPSIGELVLDRSPGAVRQMPRGAPPILFATFILVFTAANGISGLAAIRLSEELDAGRADIIEGQVTDFYEAAAGKYECFSLADRRFCYSDWQSTPGFNRTRALGGPVHPGVQIRLAAIGETIVRLEVAEPP